MTRTSSLIEFVTLIIRSFLAVSGKSFLGYPHSFKVILNQANSNSVKIILDQKLKNTKLVRTEAYQLHASVRTNNQEKRYPRLGKSRQIKNNKLANIHLQMAQIKLTRIRTAMV